MKVNFWWLWGNTQPVIAEGSLSFEGSGERPWIEGREVHPWDLETKVAVAEEKMEICIFSTETRFTDERGKHLAQQIGSKKRPPPHLLGSPVIEKDLTKYPPGHPRREAARQPLLRESIIENVTVTPCWAFLNFICFHGISFNFPSTWSIINFQSDDILTLWIRLLLPVLQLPGFDGTLALH